MAKEKNSVVPFAKTKGEAVRSPKGKEKIIAKGAEGVLYKKGKNLIKKRTKKTYRIKIIDEKIRRQRTRREAKILRKAGEVVLVPEVFSSDEKSYEIEMERISGSSLKVFLDKKDIDKKDAKKISEELGGIVGRLHKKGITHGDLTSSNILIRKEDSKIVLIDFGLGIHSNRIEDFAMDLVVLKKALFSAHPALFLLFWKGILLGYEKEAPSEKSYKETIKRIETIEKRARYT